MLLSCCMHRRRGSSAAQARLQGAQGCCMAMTQRCVARPAAAALQVLAAVRGWHADGRAYAVRGNWDDATLAARALLDQGLQPNKPKHAWAAQMLPEDVALLGSLPFSLCIEGCAGVLCCMCACRDARSCVHPLRIAAAARRDGSRRNPCCC